MGRCHVRCNFRCPLGRIRSVDWGWRVLIRPFPGRICLSNYVTVASGLGGTLTRSITSCSSAGPTIPLGFRVLAGVGERLPLPWRRARKCAAESGILDRAMVRPSRGHLSGRHSGGRTPGRNSEPALDREDKMAELKEPKCQPCAGTGKVPLTFDIVPGRMPAELMEIDCPKCGGTGRYTAPRFSSQRSQPPDRASHLANVANVMLPCVRIYRARLT